MEYFIPISVGVVIYLLAGASCAGNDSWETWQSWKPFNSPWRRLMRSFEENRPFTFRAVILFFWPPFVVVGLVFAVIVDLPVAIVNTILGESLTND